MSPPPLDTRIVIVRSLGAALAAAWRRDKNPTSPHDQSDLNQPLDATKEAA